MDNEFMNENLENEVEETVEEVVEATEEAVEEIAEAVEDVVDVAETPASEPAKKSYLALAIVGWVIAIALLIFDIGYFMTNMYNKYNHIGYLDINGLTIGDAVAGMGMEYDEFLEMYGLPKDMKKDTNMNAAQSLIPVGKMAELNGMDVEVMKETYKFGEEITAESTWGEAIESMTLRDYVGESNFEDFKTEYGFTDEDITLDTKWGEIRKTVEKLQVAKRLAEENKKAEEETAEPVEEPAAEEPVEEPEAPATDDGAEAAPEAEQAE